MHPNAERLRAAYEAYGRGDLDAVSSDWTDDVVWHITGTTPIAHDRQGRDEIMQFLGELMLVTNGTFRLEPQRYFADDDYGVVICRSSATIADQPFDNMTVHVHRIVDGKTAESWFLDERPLEEDAAMQAAFALIAAKA
jgi:ketosteroid isomerase-like protein